MGLVAVAAAAVFGQARKGATPSKAAPAKPAAAAEQKWKAIWEPVPFTKDVELKSIACIGPETCWVGGEKATILYTADGGKTWQTQMGGDPEGTEEAISEIFAIDAKHAWALTERSRLMGTTDGSSWTELGKPDTVARGLWFSSPQTGFVIDSKGRKRTDDGGKSWTSIGQCSVDTMIGGLPRKLPCEDMRVTTFVSPTAGYMGGGAQIAMGTQAATIAKTNDGGSTWSLSVIPDTKSRVTGLHFWSDTSGIARLDSGQVFWTGDGGTTWTGTPSPPRWKSHYGSGEGKIIAALHENGDLIAYSFNGGRNFTSRAFKIPAAVRDVTFFDTTHGYFVGQHGMAYRYRIVPIDYTSPGMIGAMAP
jgi:photosystem II stability/assembly factor-like uncharacterized protein